MHRHEIVESRSVFSGKLLKVLVEQIRLPDGSVATREIVRHPGAVGIVALEANHVLLVRQHRHAVGSDLLEIPAGKLDRAGEQPEACAARELEEETGYRAAHFEPLGYFFPSPGFCDERIYLFLARGLSKGTQQDPSDEGEPITPLWQPIEEVLGKVRAGEISDSKTIIGLGWALARGSIPPPAGSG